MPRPNPIALPTQDYLRACFSYDPETGVLTWRVRPREHFASDRQWHGTNTMRAGKVAGHFREDGYFYLGLAQSFYLAHRIIWKLMTGEEPPEQIDHRDVDPSNNRWDNLRSANQTEQNCNKRLRQINATGRRGVYFGRDGKAIAQFTADGVTRHLGVFATVEEAGDFADAVRREVHGEFFHG